MSVKEAEMPKLTKQYEKVVNDFNSVHINPLSNLPHKLMINHNQKSTLEENVVTSEY